VKSLIVVDVGSTLGRFTGAGRSTTAVLANLAPSTFPRDLISRTVCRLLHREPQLTEDVIREVCDELHIDRDAWPEPWPTSSFEPYEGTVDCLARLAVLGPVIALSNLSITGRPRMETLAHTCGEYLTGIYPSSSGPASRPAGYGGTSPTCTACDRTRSSTVGTAGPKTCSDRWALVGGPCG
jgi:hypothetical protein